MKIRLKGEVMKRQIHHLLAKFWWLMAMRGTLGLVFGLTAILWMSALNGWLGRPLWEETFKVLNSTVFKMFVLFFGPYAFFDGVFAVALGVQNFGEGRRWWVLILEGLMGVGLGLMTWFWPHVALLLLLYWLALWALVTGGLEITQAFHLGRYREGKMPLLVAGICSLVFGLFVAFYRGTDEGGVIWMMGAYALAFGALLLVFSFRLRRFTQSVLGRYF